jgi:Flp pilus assembly protein TadD
MRIRTLLLISAAAVGAACGSDDAAANRMTLGEADPHAGAEYGTSLPAAIQTHIDEGNTAYRARDYEGALRHYQAAADADPSQPTAWFGVAMAASAMGNEELADQARQRVQQLDPNLGAASHDTTPQQPHPVRPHP